MPLAIDKVRALLVTHPKALDDPDLAKFELNECLNQVEISEKAKQRIANVSEITRKTEVLESERAVGKRLQASFDTKTKTQLGLKNKIAANLTGDNKAEQLAELISEVATAENFSETERAAALKHLGQIAKTLNEMSTVFTDETKQAALGKIINASALDLGAANIEETFSSIIAQMELSGVFTQADKKRIRDIVTSGDLKRETLREVTNPKTGELEYAYSKDQPLEFRPGVQSYPDPQGREYMKVTLKNGHVFEQEITSMSLEDRTALAEYYQIWQIAEASGKSDLLHNSFGLALDPFADGRVDIYKLQQSRQIVDALLGGWAGSDGKIISAEGSGKFIAWQMQWLSQIGDAAQDNVDVYAVNANMRTLGIKDIKGNMNLEVMKAFGSYTQEQFGTGEPSFETLQAHLFRLYPQFVEEPESA